MGTFLQKADESTLSRLLIERVILQPVASLNDNSKVLREAAEFYKVNVATITTKVKQEFAAKNNAMPAETAQKPKGLSRPEVPI